MTFAMASTTGCASPSGPSTRNTLVAPWRPSDAQRSSGRPASSPTTTAWHSPPSSPASRAPSETAPSEFLLNAPSWWRAYTRMSLMPPLRMLRAAPPLASSRSRSSCQQLPLVEPAHDLLHRGVRVVVLDDPPRLLRGRGLEVGAVGAGVVVADASGVDAGVRDAARLQRLLLGAHD